MYKRNNVTKTWCKEQGAKTLIYITNKKSKSWNAEETMCQNLDMQKRQGIETLV